MIAGEGLRMEEIAMASKDNNEQLERFKAAARELGADEDEAAFKAKLAVIARQKPKDEGAKDTKKPNR